MKLFACLIISASAKPKNKDPERLGDDRRYADLKAMTEKVFENANVEFDERKFWGYGCHCIFPGDRPMTQMGFGKPLDGIDTVCRNWKLCQRCVREQHGEVFTPTPAGFILLNTVA